VPGPSRVSRQLSPYALMNWIPDLAEALLHFQLVAENFSPLLRLQDFADGTAVREQ
jgi:hypothetical protein